MRRGMSVLPTRLWAAAPALRADHQGVTAIEYALIAAFISILIVAAVSLVGTSVLAFFTKVANGF